MRSILTLVLLVAVAAALQGCDSEDGNILDPRQTVRLTAAPTGVGVIKACNGSGECGGWSRLFYDSGEWAFRFAIDCREGSDTNNRCSSRRTTEATRIERGFSVRLEATPDPDHRLTGWSGCTPDPSNALQCVTTIDALTPHRIVGAAFLPNTGSQVVMTLNWFEVGDLDLNVTGPTGTACQVERRDTGADASQPVHAERVRCSDADAGQYEVTVQNLSASELSYTLSIEVLSGRVSIAAAGYPVQSVLPANSGRTYGYNHP
ncbi:MAG: hypothetical protein KJO98_10900 [Rhodothermia bacterium]|nr:hypothetical protein [Rhodothermia bacterium]